MVLEISCSVTMSGYEGESGFSYTNFTEVGPGNFTSASTCAARSLGVPFILPFSSNLTTTVRSFLTIYYILILVFGVFLNTLVIVLVAKYKKLHTRTFAIATQILVINLLSCSTIFLLRPITSIANKWLFGEHMCVLTGFIFLSLLLLRLLLMFVFVIDRFLAVFWTYGYPKHSTKIMIILSLSTWVFTLVWRVLALPGIFDCYGYLSPSYLCFHSTRCSQACAIMGYISLGVIQGPASIILYTVRPGK